MQGIRPFVPDDEDGVRAAIRAVYDEYGFGWDPAMYHRDLYSMTEHFDGMQGWFWVAEVDGQIVGGGGLEIFPSVSGDKGVLTKPDKRGLVRIGGADCELVRLYLLKSARGKGLGLALAKQIVEQAMLSNCSLMEIWSDKLFTEAHHLYEKLGAKRIGQRICNDPDQAQEWGYALEIDGSRIAREPK